MINIPEKYFEILETIGQVNHYYPHDIIYMQSDDANNIYIIKKGRVRVYIPSIDGREVTLEVLQKRRLFGDASFINQSVRHVNIESIVESDIISVDTHQLLNILSEHKDLMLLIFQHLTETCNELTLKINKLVSYNSEQKVADFLLDLQKKELLNVYSQQDIADSLALNRVTVTRILIKFEEAGWIKKEYKQIKILDNKSIENILKNV